MSGGNEEHVQWAPIAELWARFDELIQRLDRLERLVEKMAVSMGINPHR